MIHGNSIWKYNLAWLYEENVDKIVHLQGSITVSII